MRQSGLAVLLALCLSLCSACADSAQGAEEPVPTPAQSQTPRVRWPRDKLAADANGIPQLDVYVADEKTVRTMDVETYVQGVLAGEMKNDWPMEALKAQAILARTFVLKFIEEKESKYPNADISTDIEEAQAYDTSAVNARIKQAVADTRGLVLSHGGELPYAWFHAHSGGVTELARPGLGWESDEPTYTLSVQSAEPENVSDPADAQTLRDAQSWSAAFPYEEFEAACAACGVETDITGKTTLSITERGESGRASVIDVNNHPVGAAELRIALGSTKMRSTLLTSLKNEDGQIHMAGKGYGHGVGMSQWGAYGMAQNGASAEEIVTHYFRNVTVEKLW